MTMQACVCEHTVDMEQKLYQKQQRMRVHV